nr:MAG TPA: hypothetical protein [Caudoviricetes sp.]
MYQFPLLNDDYGSYDPLKSNIVIVPTKPPALVSNTPL